MRGELPHTLFHLRLVGIGNDGLQMFCTISGLLQFTLRFQRRESEHPSNGCKRQQHDEHDNQDARVTASTLDTADVLGAHPSADPPTMRFAVLGILIGIS